MVWISLHTHPQRRPEPSTEGGYLLCNLVSGTESIHHGELRKMAWKLEDSNQPVSPRVAAGEYMTRNFTVYGSRLVDTGSGGFVSEKL